MIEATQYTRMQGKGKEGMVSKWGKHPCLHDTQREGFPGHQRQPRQTMVYHGMESALYPAGNGNSPDIFKQSGHEFDFKFRKMNPENYTGVKLRVPLGTCG